MPWYIRALNFRNMELVVDKEFTDTELLQFLSKDGVFEDDIEKGIKYEFKITDISDRDVFVSSLWEKVAPNGSSFRTEKQEPTRYNDIEKGAADYVIEYVGNAKSPHKEDKVFVEMKYGRDGLKSDQINWILSQVQSGYDVWVVWVEEK